MYKICTKVNNNTPEQRQCRRPGVLEHISYIFSIVCIVNFEQVLVCLKSSWIIITFEPIDSLCYLE